MKSPLVLPNRRAFLGASAFGAAMFTTAGLFAEQLDLTPRQTEGPFYPDRLPLDTDNDLLRINDQITPAVGQITHLTGRVLSSSGEPLRNAQVEIWQCDANGAYLHSRSGNAENRDSNFQGFGRFLTDSEGRYYFRTIKPVAYPGRTPHIHYAVDHGGQRMLTTQCYIQGEPQNARDGVLRGITPQAAALLMAEFKPIPGSKINELAANFNLVVGATPEDKPRRR
ncbi:dioxygenase family protein [Lignipirellula cremea]|uniref:Protocatechuate 3,4-dioxygenase beta chain n=1 Tax=Lignipirellula cremea TaxID=2528010 RepID=A0A518E180_9BACT|nr:protocatechuate 3,4-dioxygenase [Lignipirellula cremea]QDU97821.1 Protocatechuate 3,4-dioxygenase beta chain [Lignipirellula cremea]